MNTNKSALEQEDQGIDRLVEWAEVDADECCPQCGRPWSDHTNPQEPCEADIAEDVAGLPSGDPVQAPVESVEEA